MSWISDLWNWLWPTPAPPPAPVVPPVAPPIVTPPPVVVPPPVVIPPVAPPIVTPPITVTSVKAFDTTAAPTAAWFSQAYADGFRLYILSSNKWGLNAPWPQASGLVKLALDAGLKVACYTRNPTWYAAGIAACAPYVDQLEFFALDIETNPGVAVTQAMVNSVTALGVRPVIYSGSGMWPGIMGKSTAFSEVPLWDTNAGGANSMSPKTYIPNVSAPKPVVYGGWNTAANMRIGIQQTFETTYNGISVDLNSFSADFLK